MRVLLACYSKRAAKHFEAVEGPGAPAALLLVLVEQYRLTGAVNLVQGQRGVGIEKEEGRMGTSGRTRPRGDRISSAGMCRIPTISLGLINLHKSMWT